MFHTLENILMSYANTLPLEVFAFIGSMVEEIAAPIPSPTVMLLVGSAAEVQGSGVWGLLPLALIGAAGKTVGAIVVYMVADKAEDFFTNTCGRFFKISKDDIEGLGKKLGNGARDYILLTFLRALPIMPSVILSAGSGLLKLPLRLFVVSTFFGTIVRDFFYLYVGYLGSSALISLVDQSEHAEKYVEIGIVAIAVFAVGLWLYRRHRS